MTSPATSPDPASSAISVRTAVRFAPPGAAARRNEDRGFEGARAHEPTPDAIARITEQSGANRARALSWATHPDERVRIALVDSIRGDTPSWWYGEEGDALRERVLTDELERAEAAGEVWTPLLARLWAHRGRLFPRRRGEGRKRLEDARKDLKAHVREDATADELHRLVTSKPDARLVASYGRLDDVTLAHLAGTRATSRIDCGHSLRQNPHLEPEDLGAAFEHAARMFETAMEDRRQLAAARTKENRRELSRPIAEAQDRLLYAKGLLRSLASERPPVGRSALEAIDRALPAGRTARKDRPDYLRVTIRHIYDALSQLDEQVPADLLEGFFDRVPVDSPEGRMLCGAAHATDAMWRRALEEDSDSYRVQIALADHERALEDEAIRTFLLESEYPGILESLGYRLTDPESRRRIVGRLFEMLEAGDPDDDRFKRAFKVLCGRDDLTDDELWRLYEQVQGTATREIAVAGHTNVRADLARRIFEATHSLHVRRWFARHDLYCQLDGIRDRLLESRDTDTVRAMMVAVEGEELRALFRTLAEKAPRRAFRLMTEEDKPVGAALSGVLEPEDMTPLLQADDREIRTRAMLILGEMGADETQEAEARDVNTRAR